MRQPEVRHFHPPRTAEQEVGGLNVPVDDAHAVGVRQCVGGLGGELAGADVIERPLPLDQFAQRAGLDQLHRDVIHPADFVHLVHLDGVRVLERRGGPRLADELAPLQRSAARA